MTVQTKPLGDKAASNNAHLKPFSDMSKQKSKLILSIIEAVQGPLLVIYSIGEKNSCSHFKHLPRLCEYVLLAEKGQKLSYDFSKEKMEKTLKNFEKANLSFEDRIAVKNAWQLAMDNLSGLINERADIHERFVFWFVYDLVRQFHGGVNLLTFHIEKIALFQSYNFFMSNSVQIELPEESSAEHFELLALAGIPIVVGDLPKN